MSKKEIYNPFLLASSSKDQTLPSLLELNVKDFIDEIEKHLSGSEVIKNQKFDIEEYPLLPGQAIYVISYPENATINYQRGMDDLLGYSKEEVNMDLLVSYFHPNQKDIVGRIIKGAINYGINQEFCEEPDTWMLLICKIRKKDGSYVPVLRQTSVYERDTEGRMYSSFSILTDLSNMNYNDQVEFKMKGPQVNESKFKEYIFGEYVDFFTVKEKEVLKLLINNKTSKEIAELLCNSKHTVDTHRRNMLKKSNSKNTVELVDFSRKFGVTQ